MTRSTICEGDWWYSKPVWFGTFTVRNAVTGESYDTGACELVDARSFVAALAPAEQVSVVAATYTIASGPQRSRGGHQRFPGANHFE